jgi:DNA (cytosine-5)-methyltransferase 1
MLDEQDMSAPKVMSLFSGAGGLDYGLEAAGFETAVATDFDKDSCATIQQSRRWPVIHRDIFELPTAELLEVAGVKKGEIDLLAGGPPCQPFSKAGYWNRGDALRLDDPRADTLSAYMRVVEEALPRAFLLENVEGLAYEGKDEGMRLLLDKIKRINKATKSDYKPVFKVINAASYGAPQIRERVILVAARDGKVFDFPEPRFASADSEPLLGRTLPAFRSAFDAIGDLKVDPTEDLGPKGKWAGLLPSIPEGANYLWHTERGGGMPLFGWRTRFWSFLLKLAKSKPSWTIQAQPGPAIGPFHWDSRRLSVRELARLQTFPDDVKFVGGRTSVQRQIGNAVASVMAETLGRAIREQLLEGKPVKKPWKLVPPDRSPYPAPAPLGEVPAEIAKLAGKHKAHPGTGKGTRAIARSRRGQELPGLGGEAADAED